MQCFSFISKKENDMPNIYITLNQKTMKNNSKFILFVLFLASIVVVSCAPSNDYLSKNFATARLNHRKIAILPFKVRFERDNNNSNNATRSLKYYEDQEFQASLDSQKELFLQLARQVRKGKFEMVLQDFSTTNKILDEHKIVVEQLREFEMGKLARILGVDAVIAGDMYVNITRVNPYSMIPPNRFRDGIEMNVKLYDAPSGEVLWNTNYSQRPNSPNDTPHRIATTLLSQVARAIPYRNK